MSKLCKRLNGSSVRMPMIVVFSLVANNLPLMAINPQQKAWGILRVGAREDNVEKRSQAVRALGLVPRDWRAREMAEKALDDSKPEVRASAAAALGDMRSKASIPKLKKSLADKDGVVALAAAHSLLSLKDRSGYDVYYAVLTGQRKSGEGLFGDERKMLQDRKRLVEFGVETGLGFVPFGGIGFSAVRRLTKDDSAPVRAAAARVLSKDPDPTSADALVEAVSDKNWIVRAAALEAIATRDDPALLGRIEPALDDRKEAVQYAAAAAVVRLNQLKRNPRHKPLKGTKTSGHPS